MFGADDEVEIDETYLGGDAKNAHRGNRGEKTTATPGKRRNLVPPKIGVVGAIARKGNVVAKAIGTMDCRGPGMDKGGGVSNLHFPWSKELTLKVANAQS